ncbi:MAG: EamA family transporter, partial [Chloroflexota bacterium]|nr:EamA family transporter [Chloroflexota bacterium]
MLDRFPPAGMVILAVLGFQLGSVVAKPAIENEGAIHAAFVRTALAAVLLLVWQRPRFPLSSRTWRFAVGSGALIAGNTLLMFAAFERIPIGIAIAIGFWGPMVVALHGSRRLIDFAWV